MGYESKSEEARRAVKEFEEARNEILDFFRAKPEFLDEFLPLADRYNKLLTEAKNHVRNLEGDEKVSVGPFTRSSRPKSTTYDATKVNPEVLTMPGVVKKIDATRVNALIVSGKISHTDVEDGQSVSYGTARVNAPGLITIKVV